MAASTSITRRNVLKAAPAAMVAGVVPALADAGEGEIARLFAEWKSTCAALRVARDDAACAQIHERRISLLHAIAAAPAHSARDLSLKLLATTEFGEDWLTNTTWGEVVLADMLKIAGEEDPGL